QVQVGEVPRVPGIAVHVTDGVEMNQESDAGDDEQHDTGEWVDLGLDPRIELADHDPGKEADRHRVPTSHAREDDARCRERRRERRHRDPVSATAGDPPEEKIEEGAGQRTGGNQPNGGRHAANLSGGPRSVKQTTTRARRYGPRLLRLTREQELRLVVRL